MTTDLEKSFKAKLRAIAKEKNRDPADLWQNLTLERFLVRLARSQYHEHFVLKGAILLSKYIELGRETNDLDFLARKLSNEVGELKNIFEEIASIDLKDGFTFQELKVSELAHPHMGYPGAEVAMIAYFGNTRFKVAIDIGFGDIVEPIEYSIPLTSSSKGVLFESSVKLSCYPKEFIFAEKLETIVHRGSFNSRMKDFHDLYSMISSSQLPSFHNLEEIIRSVFEHRETILALPITYEEDEILRMQNFWNEYLKNLRAENLDSLPINMALIISKINDWLRLNTSLIGNEK
ncbi:MAG: nucleotidyl transferase AbiEii/AbiGii toxin family protein [Bacteriovoracaceae bacterium]|nr:nucleotidyl transferase AbiEii/AbiGii toxin family protein [Bacteriovoracaceae bacterium]